MFTNYFGEKMEYTVYIHFLYKFIIKYILVLYYTVHVYTVILCSILYYYANRSLSRICFLQYW